MSFSPSRRRLLQAAAVAAAGPVVGSSAARAAPPGATAVVEAAASAFHPGRVRLTESRWLDNQNRTAAYLRFVDVQRLLYNFRANHGLSTGGASPTGGWEAPDFPFRTHSQGHFLSAWSWAHAVTGDDVFRQRAETMVAGLAACQANNGSVGYHEGYLSGYPESEFDALEDRSLANGNVPYYTVHKTLAGLLDVWRLLGGAEAREVALALAGWVDLRTGRLSEQQRQAMLATEFGGMNDVLADLHQETGDGRWLTVAQRFDHAAVFDPLAAGQDRLSGLHANTQVPKWIGAVKEYRATGDTRYLDIATHAWDFTVGAHTYAIGGNSQAEHFRPPHAIASHLHEDTCESCNTFNMLKLTRDLFALAPERADLFDFYERAWLNHMIGQQDPASAHGHITYFTPLNPGGRRGVGPAWGGGTWSTDYDSFWCCQGTGVETHTRLMDSVYFHTEDALTVNLFVPSVLDWSERGVTVTQRTSFPVGDTTTLEITGGGEWSLRVRVPGWTTDATISVNGAAQDVATTPGSYATVTRAWSTGDTVTVRLPMGTTLWPAQDDPNVAAVAYGPVVLCGDYGDRTPDSLPALDVPSVTRTDEETLTFAATADGSPVTLGPFHDAHGHNYTVYWRTDGRGGGNPAVRLVNAASGLVLGIENMSTADGGRALQWHDTGTADHRWEPLQRGGETTFRNVHSGKVLGVQDMSTADDAPVLQWSDTGTADHRWTVLDEGDGTHRIRNAHSGKLLGVLGGSTEAGAYVVQTPDDGSADNLWHIVSEAP
ncbi:beta-L-arabinofuranosidase domain-containing protein [Streptomyces profundus]|uniref:beta-L-arabinofuranosidase domain-containing protein n=1 Tax=Streptomyces profundus TaxID=2867410 RepID=UPI001D167AB5|nr:beta-L-arabinofuranosidase domain-containing protein [Streptomyces sp. MA3_2.13]UED87980.1 glycoside hydrolase family 127 protein [Streptomyces sp. MA3_2.13]